VNFRDVMNVLGMVETPWLGLELAGVVSEVADDVTSLKVGDKVLGLADSTFASSTTADARFLTTIPAGMSFEDAASIPLVFLTAFYALFDLGKLQSQEKVLIHAAAGGVGMAAVQLAQWKQAEIYGTASQPKWDTLRGMGLGDDHIASSRTLGYAQAFPKVDVVLNALAREFVDANFTLLNEGGRFLEMGKTDIREPGWVEENYAHTQYAAFELLEAGPDRIQEMLQALSKLLEAGTIRPLPVLTYPIKRISTAFRFMAQARHIGKVVMLPHRESSFVQAEGTVLITGGLGALGQAVARWLVAEHGVSHLVLTSRRGMEAPEAATLVEELKAAGAGVQVEACDVSDSASLATVLAQIPEDKPLRGIIHAAGVLADGVLSTMSSEDLTRVLDPKVAGAWNLHSLTREYELDFCVFFSSIAGVVGAAGQGNYAAANVFLDSLASYRRAHGLVATSIAWGPWAAAGMAQGLSDIDRERMRSQGISELNQTDGMAVLESAAAGEASLIVGAAFDPSRLQRDRDAGTISRLFHALVQAPGTSFSGGSFTTRLEVMAPAEREEELVRMVREVVAQVLGLSGAMAVKPSLALKDLGLDSLMAVELRNRLVSLSGISLPATLVFDFPNCQAIANHLLEELNFDEMPAGQVPLSDDELRAALQGLSLEQLRASGLLPQLLSMQEAGAQPDEPQDDYEDLDDEEMLRQAMLLIED